MYDSEVSSTGRAVDLWQEDSHFLRVYTVVTEKVFQGENDLDRSTVQPNPVQSDM